MLHDEYRNFLSRVRALLEWTIFEMKPGQNKFGTTVKMLHHKQFFLWNMEYGIKYIHNKNWVKLVLSGGKAAITEQCLTGSRIGLFIRQLLKNDCSENFNQVSPQWIHGLHGSVGLISMKISRDILISDIRTSYQADANSDDYLIRWSWKP